MNNTGIRNQLQSIINDQPDSIRAEVAKFALDSDYDDIRSTFRDLLTQGCISGMVPSLIYYSDTHAFYDRHYQEIEALRDSYEEMLGEPPQINGDLKNVYAWFAFEETARQICDELELDF